MADPSLTPEDLRAAVATGHLTEAQAAGLIALAQARAGRRAATPKIDEPFELFRGFNEIFGLVEAAATGSTEDPIGVGFATAAETKIHEVVSIRYSSKLSSRCTPQRTD